jgi:L-ascorbate metabolism protein UlaG (beta-lactamase superfamily)
VGLVVELENGFRFYFAGDTTAFGDMAFIRELHAPQLAFLPIGGHFTMDPVGAALATELLGVQHVLPIHWGTFPVLSGTPAQLADAIAARGGTAHVHAWNPGDSVD